MNKPLVAAEASEARPYHHGDLRRALTLAAERILEREGPQALSLRAVAREAGVSPAAPYHHFKDKSDLLMAIAGAGFEALGEALKSAVEADKEQRMTTIGCAYVKFARENPALYRVMYDCSRNEDAMPGHEEDGEDQKEHGGLKLVEQSMIRAGVDPKDPVGLKLACITAWCAAHGIAEMVGFAQFKPVIEEMGGEEKFIEALIARSCSVAAPRV